MSLAYIAGIIASDGHISKNTFKVSIITSNIEFAHTLRQILKDLGIKSGLYRGKTGYEIFVYNKNFWNILTSKYKVPPGKKSHNLQTPDNLSKEEQIDYLRGLLDGDSSIFETTAKLKRKQKIYIYYIPRIEYKSKTKLIIDWSLKFLSEIGIKPYIQKDPNFHRWFLDGAENIRKFSKIGFLHPEKQERLRTILKTYSDKRYYRTKNVVPVEETTCNNGPIELRRGENGRG